VRVLTSFANQHTIMYFEFRTRGRRGRDRMVVGFTTSYAVSAYNH